jgi:hypothetical protein
MIKKEFVPYQESVELKEIGFDEPCFGYRDGENYLMIQSIPHCVISAPTFSQAFRWFREKFKLHSKVDIQDVELDWYDYEIVVVKEGQYNNEIQLDMNFKSYEEAELACLRKLIEIVKNLKKDLAS